MARLRNRKIVLGVVVLIVGGGAGVFWLERATLDQWFYVRQLARADEGQREAWARRVAGLGERAVPDVVDLLASPAARVCRNAQAALAELGADDARRTDLVLRLARDFGRLSPAGQRCALELPTGWFAGAPQEATAGRALVAACARLLGAAEGVPDPEIQGAGLGLAATLLAQPQRAEALSAARAVAGAGLCSPEATNRLQAVCLSLQPGTDLLERVAPLLRDPDAKVRRTAVLAIGPAAEVVSDEGLLACLHDPDAEVRRLAELALRGRGLRPEQIELGRLLSHPSAGQRLRVLDLYRRVANLDAGLWLRRLSQDASPAVRAAAVREMSRRADLDLRDRMDQMAHDDPSPTVCELARFYGRLCTADRRRP